jgi:hypothetical protein
MMRIFVAGVAIAVLVTLSGCAKGDKGDKGDQGPAGLKARKVLPGRLVLRARLVRRQLARASR